MPVLLQIPENPNCEPVDGQVFACRTPSQVVTHIRRRRDDRDAWCSVIGMNPSGELCPAVACIVEDSGDGACYLVVGGAWAQDEQLHFADRVRLDAECLGNGQGLRARCPGRPR